MIPTRKISETILDFGSSVFQSLPQDSSKFQFEAAARVVVCAWNAVVLDAWHKTDRKYEKSLLFTLSEEPKEMQLIVKRLVIRKKKKFSSDPRAVGHYEIIERDGELIFRAEARGDIEHMEST